MDDATLLRVGFVLENKQRLGVLFAMLPGERLDRLIAAAADEGLWIEALDLLGHLEAEQRAAIVDGTADLDHAAMEAIIAAVIEHELWDEVLIVAEGDVVLQAKLAQRLPALPADQRETIARRAAEVDAIGRLGPLGEALARI